MRHRNHRWRIDDIDIHRAGFPILSEGVPSLTSKVMGMAVAVAVAAAAAVQTSPSAASRVRLRLQPPRHLEHAACICFWVRDASLHSIALSQHWRRQVSGGSGAGSMATLQQTARALGSRFIVVRGGDLGCDGARDFRRAEPRRHSLPKRRRLPRVPGQWERAGGAGPPLRGAGAAYVLLPDLDEFISPPVSDAFMPRRLEHTRRVRCAGL